MTKIRIRTSDEFRFYSLEKAHYHILNFRFNMFKQALCGKRLSQETVDIKKEKKTLNGFEFCLFFICIRSVCIILSITSVPASVLSISRIPYIGY